MDFSEIKSVHFIGIGGIGTSAISRMFLLEGKKVSGADMAGGEVTKAPQEVGIVVYVGNGKDNIPKDCELVIYSIAIPKDHPEIVEAKRRGIPVMTYPEALGVISKEKY